MNVRLGSLCFWFGMYAAAVCCEAQTNNPAWTLQTSGTTASLRGIASVDGKIAWASGSEGTVLRTTDGGQHWTQCATPPDAKTLDFRGIQALDADTAIVMSSGPGDKSRLYSTSDGCKSWTLMLKNPDARTPASPDASQDGFFDSFFADWSEVAGQPKWTGSLLGDAVNGHLVLLDTPDAGADWRPRTTTGLDLHGMSLGGFAASNSLFPADQDGKHDAHIFATGGKSGAVVWIQKPTSPGALTWSPDAWSMVKLPLAGGADSTGIFSIAIRTESVPYRNSVTEQKTLIAVGGDYARPGETAGTAAWSIDEGQHWKAADKMPHGFRSAVAWSADLNLWIAAGTNGSDISRDDGKTWTSLDDGSWNALSLPFVVGPKGRIARLSTIATMPAK